MLTATHALQFSILHVNGTSQELVIDADTALIGSGAHCEVRLTNAGAAVEHVEVQHRQGNVFLEARSMSPPALLNGVPFSQARFLQGSVLRVGSAEIQIQSVRSQADLDASEPRKQKSTKAIHLLGLVGFPLGFYVLFGLDKGTSSLPLQVNPPALWDTAVSVSCPEPTRAAAFAEQELARAEAARERAPFNAEVGVRAVKAFERAAACLRDAAEPAREAQARAAALSLKKRVSDDFHVHQVRLERALATKEYEHARTEIRILLSFLENKRHEYASWLSNLDRQIELKFAGKKRR
ncbi:MAG TPA: hypothetical protein VK524_02465 [Polyangiaceae bacterium]|nr:hypothetical protein [Polyangiaceae bacterium]